MVIITYQCYPTSSRRLAASLIVCIALPWVMFVLKPPIPIPFVTARQGLVLKKPDSGAGAIRCGHMMLFQLVHSAGDGFATRFAKTLGNKNILESIAALKVDELAFHGHLGAITFEK